MGIVRNTKSVCPKCIKNIDAQIVEQGSSIYMLKECKVHGKFKILLSDYLEQYKGLTKSYFSFKNKRKQDFYQLILTMNCNLNCPVCFINANRYRYEEPTLDWIKKRLKSFKNVKIGLFGGEPTLRKDLFEIIKLVKESGNTPLLFTNGVELSNSHYAKIIKDSGVNEVHLQFDGFSTEGYRKMRGKDLTQQKKLALENLKNYDIPTVLETTHIKDLNEQEISNIFEFALKNDFIQGVVFRPYCFIGRKGIKDSTLNVEDIMHNLEKKQRISLENINRFQKVVYFVGNFFKIKKCFYNKYYLVFRTKNGYKTIDEVINVEKMEKRIDSIRKKPSKIDLIRLLSPLLLNFKNYKYYFKLHRFLKRNPVTFSSTKKNNLLILAFAIICESSNFDYQLLPYCNQGEISTDFGVNDAVAVPNILREKGEKEKN
ncbi:MAG: radical SAM protein [Nanoarchaeota archaeon]|nr:radical SAM protein [Nanoarchaeota archaeon]